jgi:hypothetical protein
MFAVLWRFQEALAFTFVRGNMLEEALTLYEELEDQFYQLNGLERRDRSVNEETSETKASSGSSELVSVGEGDSTLVIQLAC